MQILKQPNVVLKERSVEIVDFTQMPFIVRTLEDTAKENRLAGLAGNQVGYNGRFFIADMGGGVFEMFINPKIKMNQKAGKDCSWESCASVFNKACLVERFKSLTITAQNVQGEFFTKELSGKLARTVQHENDHLNGVMITDKARETKKV